MSLRGEGRQRPVKPTKQASRQWIQKTTTRSSAELPKPDTGMYTGIRLHAPGHQEASHKGSAQTNRTPG